MSIDQLFEKLPNLPAVPKVVKVVLESLSNPEVSITPLVSELKSDPVLSAKVLRLANSPFYGVSVKVNSIDKAAMSVGLNPIKNIVLTSFMTKSVDGEGSGLNLPNFWRHAMLTAVFSEMFARRAGLDSQSAYTAGLIHSIGVLLLALAYPSEYASIVKAGTLRPHELVKLEHNVLELDHCQAGAELAKRWGFPWSIVDAIADYSGHRVVGDCKLAATIYIASVVATGINEFSEIDDSVFGLTSEHLSLLKWDIAAFKANYESLKSIREQVSMSLEP